MIFKLLYIYNKDLNAYQKYVACDINGADSPKGLSLNLIRHMTVSYETVNALLDSFAAESMNALSNWREQDVVHCGDNVDIRKKARYELAGRSGVDLHMYNNILYKTRVNVDTLSDIPPSVPSADEVDYSQFILDAEANKTLMGQLKPLVARSWSMSQDKDEHLKSCTSLPPHEYAAEMKLKSERVRNKTLLLFIPFYRCCKGFVFLSALQFC